MQVISTKSIHFPKFNWGINAGETRGLPSDKSIAEAILAHPAISEVKKASKKAKETKADN